MVPFSLVKILPKCNFISGCLKQPFIFHFFHFSHHGASVHRKIIGQCTVGKGQGKMICSRLRSQNREITLNFFTDGTLAEHLQPLTELHCFLREDREEDEQ